MLYTLINIIYNKHLNLKKFYINFIILFNSIKYPLTSIEYEELLSIG
jgi:hypothetical protein